jgi:hypothetical protein
MGADAQRIAFQLRASARPHTIERLHRGRTETEGTTDIMTSPVQDMGVNHGRRGIDVAQELLDGANVAAAFSKCVATEPAKVR